MPIMLLWVLFALGACFAASQAGELISRQRAFDMPHEAADQLALACLQVPAGRLALSEGNRCMEPSLPSGHLHVVVAGYLEKTCWSHWLFDLGLTNAEVCSPNSEEKGPLRGPCLVPAGLDEVSSLVGLAGALCAKSQTWPELCMQHVRHICCRLLSTGGCRALSPSGHGEVPAVWLSMSACSCQIWAEKGQYSWSVVLGNWTHGSSTVTAAGKDGLGIDSQPPRAGLGGGALGQDATLW